LASIHEAQGEPKRSRELLEKSLKLFGDLERAGALTPAMRVDYGFALTSAVILNGNQRLFLEAVPYAERAEAVLRPALADPQQGGLVQRQLATAQFSHGWVLARTGGRARMAVPLVEQAMANAREADRKSPLPRHPGLQAATMAWLLSETLSDSNRARESREINGKARMELRAMLEKEPFLFRAKEPLALCDLRVVTEASADWDYPRLEEALQEGQRLYLEILKYDPKNVTARGVFGNTWTISRRSVDLRNRDYAAAEKAIRTGLPYLADEPTNDRNLARARDAMAQLAWIYAATGRDAEADAALAKAEEYGALANQKRSAGPTAYALSHALRTGLRRFVESARLNWSAVRQNTEETLAALSQIKASMPDESAQMNEFRNDLHLDLMTAAFALGDYATARRALDSVTRLRGKWSPRTGASMQVRFNTSGEQLWKCQVLHRAGEIDEARQLLSTLWPEVEAVFAKAPEVIGNQLRMAWALWIKSEVALGADAAARRVLLERAASYLRPAAAAGKLNRYEREVLLPEVEAGLAGKPAFVPSGRLIAEGLPALRARALAMRNQGDYAAAEPIDRELLALTIKEQGEEGRDVVGNRSILAETLLRVGKLEEAEQLARVVLVGREKDNPPGSYNVATAHRRLGSVLVAQKRFAEAEPLLLKACESTRLRITRSGRSQSESNLLTEGVNSLVDLYAAIGRPEKAAEWKKILADLTGQPLAAPKPPGNP
jgi:tetratricopeptide (TPR) repeat protein